MFINGLIDCISNAYIVSIVILILACVLLLSYLFCQKKRRLYAAAKVTGIAIAGLACIVLHYLYYADKDHLFNGSTLWVFAVVFLSGLFIIFVDISKIRLFEAGGIVFELEQTRGELKDLSGELFNTQGNLNKLQWNWAKAMYDYAFAAKFYAEKGKWPSVFNMLGMIDKYTELKKDKLKVFGESMYGYKEKQKPFKIESKEKTMQDMKEDKKGISKKQIDDDCKNMIEDFLAQIPPNIKRRITTTDDNSQKANDAILHCYIKDTVKEKWLEHALAKLREISCSAEVEEHLTCLSTNKFARRLEYTIGNLNQLIEVAKHNMNQSD